MKSTLPFFLAFFLSAIEAHAGDWSNWRGPEGTGVSRERGLPTAFDLVWSAKYGGRTTPIVQKGHVYLINKCGDGPSLQERVQCFNEADGKLVWEHKFNVWHTDIVEDRLGWTTMVGDPETDTVFAHGTQGELVCFDSKGKLVWSHSLTEEYGRISGYGGRTTSPIVDGEMVIIGMLNAGWGYNAVGRNRFVAFNKRNGKVLWWNSTGNQPKDTYYSIPVVSVIGGERLLVSGAGDGGVHAFKARTGEKVWSYIFSTGAVNVSPVVDGNLIYIGHGEPNDGTDLQGSVICLDGAKLTDGKPTLVWRVDGIKAKFCSPVLDKEKGRLYIANDLGRLFCLDSKTGKQKWFFDYGKNSKGSPVLAEGRLYVGQVDYRFDILQPEEDKCTKVFTRRFGSAEINGSPAIANGRVYFMTSTDLYCLGKPSAEKADPIPPPVMEPPIAPGAKATFIQVYPAEVVLHPGETALLKAYQYNSVGQLLGEVSAEWSLESMQSPEGIPPPPAGAPKPPVLAGELSDKSGVTTTFKASPAPPPGQYGRIIAKVGELTGAAQVRVAIKLPYKADFSKIADGRTPAGWVNTQGKFLIQTLPDGSKVLTKRNDVSSPLVARANGYITLPNETNYTIESEVRGSKVGTDLPDVGIVANRYTLMIAGNSKQLKLGTWDALPRLDENKSFELKPDVWYKMKLMVDVKGDKALVKGKVWESGTSEPAAWTIELEDTAPNKEGAAALYGLSTGILPGVKGTEIWYRNVSVVPNAK